MDYDFLILGGGSAGYSAGRLAGALGLKVAILDGAERLGGLCINRGCMPSKGLIASANRVRAAKAGAEFGFSVGEVVVDWPRLRARKDELIADFQSYREESLQQGNFDLIEAHGRFVGPHEVELLSDERGGGGRRAGQRLSFRYALVGTGSKIFVPPIKGLEQVGYWTSDDVLEMTELPKSVVILGAGIIGMECAHFLRALGVEVVVVQRSGRILTGFDEDLAAEVAQASVAQGVELLCGSEIEEVRDAGERGIEWRLAGDDWRSAEKLLVATGRRPAVDGLNLEAVGLGDCAAGLEVDQVGRTAQGHILAAGDVVKGSVILHRAVVDGERIGRFVAEQFGKPVSASEVPLQTDLVGVFTHPELAYAGLREPAARAKYENLRVASYPFNDSGRGLLEGARHGLAKVMVDGDTGVIVGAGIVGPHACELIHQMVVAIELKATALQVARMPHYHPTLAEIWTYPLEELAGLD